MRSRTGKWHTWHPAHFLSILSYKSVPPAGQWQKDQTSQICRYSQDVFYVDNCIMQKLPTRQKSYLRQDRCDLLKAGLNLRKWHSSAKTRYFQNFGRHNLWSPSLQIVVGRLIMTEIISLILAYFSPSFWSQPFEVWLILRLKIEPKRNFLFSLSSILKFSPWLNSDRILRVGGNFTELCYPPMCKTLSSFFWKTIWQSCSFTTYTSWANIVDSQPSWSLFTKIITLLRSDNWLKMCVEHAFCVSGVLQQLVGNFSLVWIKLSPPFYATEWLHTEPITIKRETLQTLNGE